MTASEGDCTVFMLIPKHLRVMFVADQHGLGEPELVMWTSTIIIQQTDL